MHRIYIHYHFKYTLCYDSATLAWLMILGSRAMYVWTSPQTEVPSGPRDLKDPYMAHVQHPINLKLFNLASGRYSGQGLNKDNIINIKK